MLGAMTASPRATDRRERQAVDREDVLEEEAAGAGVQGGERVLVDVVRGEDDDAGSGSSVTIRRVAAMPSVRGILTSMRTTSGRSRRVVRTASSPTTTRSTASPADARVPRATRDRRWGQGAGSAVGPAAGPAGPGRPRRNSPAFRHHPYLPASGLVPGGHRPGHPPADDQACRRRPERQRGLRRRPGLGRTRGPTAARRLGDRPHLAATSTLNITGTATLSGNDRATARCTGPAAQLGSAATGPIEVELHALHGGPLDGLLDLSADAELLVLGHGTHSGVGRLLHGAVSDDLSALVPCPVAVIPAPTAP
jgi:hypothetical protein